MVTVSDKHVGFVEINLGSTSVKVPIREAPGLEGPAAAFAPDTDGGIILVRDGASDRAVQRDMPGAARDACTHFSRKLLN